MRGIYYIFFFFLRKFLTFYTYSKVCQVAEDQTWKTISSVAMDFTKACLELYTALYRQDKARFFLELHSSRIRDSVNKLHQGTQ